MTDIDIAIIDYECGNIHSARKAFELGLSELEISGKGKSWEKLPV